MPPCSLMLRCFRPPRSSSSVARSMPFWPGGTGQARCGSGARWFYLNTCLRLHARGRASWFSPYADFSLSQECMPPRCDQGRGGYVFPWVGIWNRRGTIVPPGFTPQQAWDRHARLDASMDLLLLQPYRTPYSADDFVPSYLWEFQQKVPGDFDLSPLQTFQSEVLYYMRHWILGSPHGLWSNPFRAPLPSGRPSPEDSCPLSPSWMVGVLNQRRDGVSSGVLRLW